MEEELTYLKIGQYELFKIKQKENKKCGESTKQNI